MSNKYMWGKTPNQPSKFRRKKWVAMNNDSRGTPNPSSQIKFKILMLKLGFCDYSDADALVTGTTTVLNTGAAANPNNRKIK